MQGRVDMSAGVFVDRILLEVEAMLGEIEQLLVAILRLAEIGGEFGRVGMAHVDRAAMGGGARRGADRTADGGGGAGHGGALEQIAAVEHLGVHRIHHADIAHGFVSNLSLLRGEA